MVLWVGVRVGVDDGPGVSDGSGVGVSVGVDDGPGVGVRVGVDVGVGVGVAVNVAVGCCVSKEVACLRCDQSPRSPASLTAAIQ